MFGSWVDVISNRRPRRPKARSCNTSSATLKGRRKSRIQPKSIFFYLNASNNKWIHFSEKNLGVRCTVIRSQQFQFPDSFAAQHPTEQTNPEERRRGALSCLQNKTSTAPRRKVGKTEKNKENQEHLGQSSQLQKTACSSDMDYMWDIKTEQTSDKNWANT